MTKKIDLKRELARRLSTQLGRRVDLSEILDRREAAEAAGYHPNHWTNGYADLPNFYFADPNRFGPNGLMLFVRSHVERRSKWESTNLGWPDASNEPSTADFIKHLDGWSP